MKNKTILVIAAVILAGPIAHAISETIPVQGKLTDAQGNALTGTYSMLFEIYDNNSNGSLLWAETQNLSVANGIFNATLGDVNTDTYLNSVDFNSQTWISILIDGTRQEPMIKLGSSPSAYSSKHTYGGDSNFANIGISGTVFGASPLIIEGDVNVHDDLNASGVIQGGRFKSGNQRVIASGANAIAFGKGPVYAYSIEAEGVGSMAFGDAYNATGDLSGISATGIGSLAHGQIGHGYIDAVGIGSTAFGYLASGTYDLAITSSGKGSMALGYAEGGGSQGIPGIIGSGGDGSVGFGYAKGGNIGPSSSNAKGSLSFGYAEGGYGNAYIETTKEGAFAGGYAFAFEPFEDYWDSKISATNNGAFAFGYVNQLEGYTPPDTYYTSNIYLEATGLGSVAMGVAEGNSGERLRATGKGAVALGYNVQSLAEASVTLGRNLTNYDANSVLVNDLNVAGVPHFDNNFTIKRASDGTFFTCGVDAAGDFKCWE
jgi:hypothetical protein